MTDANGTHHNLESTPKDPRRNAEDPRDPLIGPAVPRPTSRYLPNTPKPSGDEAPAKESGMPRPPRVRSIADKPSTPSPRRSRRERRRGNGGSTRSTASKLPKAVTPKAVTSRVAGSRTARTRSTSSTKAGANRKLKIAGSPMPPSRTAFGKQTPVGKTPKSAAGKAAGKNAAASSPTRQLSRRRSARRSFKLSKPVLLFLRLLIGGLGIAAIGGTILAIRPNSGSPSAARTESALATDSDNAVVNFPVTLNQEIAPLKAKIEGLPNTYPGLTPKAFYIDVDTGDYVSVSGQEAIAAASTIKLPILLAFFEEIDAGRLTLNQTMAISKEQIAEGSGEMQLSPPGTQFTALEVATRMIVNTDNTATNMMIDLMGGAVALNSRFADYGLEQTKLVSPLPDLEGANTISARDLVHTLLMISQGDTLTMRSRDRILNILNRTYNKSLLAFGLEEKEALTYNKTGDIESVLGDAALVDLSNGKRYAVAVLVERPSNDNRAAELIHKVSKSTYQEAEKAIQPAVSPLGDSESGTPNPPTSGAGANGEAPVEAGTATGNRPTNPGQANDAEPANVPNAQQGEPPANGEAPL